MNPEKPRGNADFSFRTLGASPTGGVRAAFQVVAAAALMISANAHAVPGVERAQVVRTYPHDRGAFTEGLLIRDGWLFESTGQEGRSFIAKKDIRSGRTVQRVAIPSRFFGEGIVDWKKNLYSFVWHGQQGYIWSLKRFEPAGTWHYNGEGWGLTQDGRHIIMSDGTSVLRFLQPGSMKVVRRLSVTADGRPVAKLNELEFVEGEILANVWQSDLIARIDPRTGQVKGWIDVSALWKKAGNSGPDAVPNGVAYDHEKKRLYVTGKNWPLLFEIKLPRRGRAQRTDS